MVILLAKSLEFVPTQRWTVMTHGAVRPIVSLLVLLMNKMEQFLLLVLHHSPRPTPGALTPELETSLDSRARFRPLLIFPTSVTQVPFISTSTIATIIKAS